MNSDNQTQPTSPKLTSTVVGGWAVAVSRALDALGCDGDALLNNSGIHQDHKLDVDARFNAAQTRQLWQQAKQETGLEDIGLQVAQFVCPTTFHALGFSLWASHSLFDALQRMVRFEVLLNDGCHLHLEDTDQHYTFTMAVKQQGSTDLVTPEGVDYFLGAVIKMFRDMSAIQLSPVRLSLKRSAPQQPQLWERYFNCPIEFSADHNQLLFDQQQLRQTLATGNAELAAQNDKLVENYLSKMERQDLLSQVRRALIELMPLGTTTLDGISDALEIPARTLKYKLNQQGTTLQEFRDQIREELARQYLEHSRQPFTQIAYSLGFSDPAHFNRAFKRWTQETPTAYRQRTTKPNLP